MQVHGGCCSEYTEAALRPMRMWQPPTCLVACCSCLPQGLKGAAVQAALSGLQVRDNNALSTSHMHIRKGQTIHVPWHCHFHQPSSPRTNHTQHAPPHLHPTTTRSCCAPSQCSTTTACSSCCAGPFWVVSSLMHGWASWSQARPLTATPAWSWPLQQVPQVRMLAQGYPAGGRGREGSG